MKKRLDDFVAGLELRVKDPRLEVDGICAVVMLNLYRYHQHHVCKVSGKW